MRPFSRFVGGSLLGVVFGVCLVGVLFYEDIPTDEDSLFLVVFCLAIPAVLFGVLAIKFNVSPFDKAIQTLVKFFNLLH